jgi:hypothetical protein
MNDTQAQALAQAQAQARWLFAAGLLLVGGGTLGPLFDAIHTHTATTYYPEVWYFRMAWWVPPLFAGAGLGFGVAPLVFDRVLRRERVAPSGQTVAVAFTLFVLAYGVSGLFKAPWPYQVLAQAAFFALAWWWCDRSLLGIFLSLAAGLMGTAVEVTLVQLGRFHYYEHQWLGVPAWLPVLYFTAQVALSTLGRRWAYGAPQPIVSPASPSPVRAARPGSPGRAPRRCPSRPRRPGR